MFRGIQAKLIPETYWFQHHPLIMGKRMTRVTPKKPVPRGKLDFYQPIALHPATYQRTPNHYEQTR